MVPHFVSYYKKYTGSNKIYSYYLARFCFARVSLPLPNILLIFTSCSFFCKKYKRVYNLIHYRKRWTRNGCIYNAFFLPYFCASCNSSRSILIDCAVRLLLFVLFLCVLSNFTLIYLFLFLLQATLLHVCVCVWVSKSARKESCFFVCHYNIVSPILCTCGRKRLLLNS